MGRAHHDVAALVALFQVWQSPFAWGYLYPISWSAAWLLQASGVDVLDSMDILSETIGNTAIGKELENIKDRLAEGRGIACPLGEARYFTPMLINMVAIGEESGNLESMMQEVATHYDTEVEYAMKKMSEAIGPLLTVGLAAVVGFFALAIFLPMWDLTLMAK